MKKTISLLCVVLVVGFAGTAFAKKMPKVDVCHNGSVYIGDTDEDINGAPPEYDPNAWVDGSFVINISGNAVTKHEFNHGDLAEPNFSVEGFPLVTTEVTFGDDGSGSVVITGFEMQQSCGEIVEPDPVPPE